MNNQNFEKRLFILNDEAHKPSNDGSIDKIRFFEERLKENPMFIGLGIYGSTVSGYEVSDSDIDLVIFCDPTLDDKLDKKNYLVNLAEEVKEEIYNSSGKDVNFSFVNVNLDVVQKFLNDFNTEHININNDLIEILSSLTFVTTGDIVKNYRETIAQKIHQLPEDKKNILVEKVIEFLANKDALSLSKRKERLPEINGLRQEDVINHRKQMWDKRVRNFWLK